MPAIDLDQNATTPLDPSVLDAMRPYWLAGGNPESRHSLGRTARRALEHSRESIARILGALPEEVVFTSGGTEANNLAIFGLTQDSGLRTQDSGKLRIIASPIEHPAVSVAINRLEMAGFVIDRAGVDGEGRVDAQSMADLIQPETKLATLMLANNETGVLQPVAELARLAELQGVPVHTDAVQAVGRIPVDFHALGVATLAASAHKFHGPGGIGLLLVRRGIKLTPRSFGGGQQKGRRPGTPTVPLAVGMARALERWQAEAEERSARWSRLTDRLESGLKAALGADRVIRNGPASLRDRLPQTLNLGFPGLDGDALLMQLDLAGVAISLGSACASGASEPSPTLLAMKVPADRLRSSVRFSLGAMTTVAEVEETLVRVIAVVERIARAESLTFE
jgi:cysteine desulfurase